MKSDRQRIDELEAQVAGLMRQLAQICRTATPLNIRNGWWLGKIYGSALSQGGSATVRVWIRSGAGWRDSQVSFTAYDWFLNEGESIAAGIKVRIDFYHNVWVITNAYCDPSDTEDSALSPSVPQGSQGDSPIGSPPESATGTEGGSAFIDDEEFEAFLTSGGVYEWGKLPR